MKQLGTSMKQYNMMNQKAKTEQNFAQTKINKFRVHMILRAKKRKQENLKRNKMHGMAMFVSMYVVKNYALQPSNAHAQHRKQTPVR